MAHASGVRPEIPVTAADVWRAFGQMYFDTITHDVAALRYLVQRVGADHVLLGTDLPFDMALAEPDEVLAEAFDEPLAGADRRGQRGPAVRPGRYARGPGVTMACLPPR